MVDQLKDFFDEIKLRVRSPLISSYIIAWIFVNWRIPVALIFYSQTDLQKDGFNSYFDLISKQSGWSHFLFIPLIFALFYSLGYPYLAGYINYLRSLARKWSSNLLRKNNIGSWIPYSQYLKISQDYAKLEDDLKKMLGKREVSDVEIEKLTNLNRSLTDENKRLGDNYSIWANATNPSILQGEWDLEYREGKDRPLNKERIRFNGKGFDCLNENLTSVRRNLILQFFFFEPIHRKLTMIFKVVNGDQIVIIDAIVNDKFSNIKFENKDGVYYNFSRLN